MCLARPEGGRSPIAHLMADWLSEMIKVERVEKRETREELSEVYLKWEDGGYKYWRGRWKKRFSQHEGV